MNYSYDRTKTASFQDRFKGAFDGVVWINAFTSRDGGKTIEIDGKISFIPSGGEPADFDFKDVVVGKKRRKWAIVKESHDSMVNSMLTMLIAQGGKTQAELTRLQKVLAQ